MVAVPQNHCRQISAPPIVKVHVVVVDILAFAPAVEGFVDHQHTQPITGVQKRGSRRVVGAAHRIEAVGFEQFHLALFSTVI